LWKLSVSQVNAGKALMVNDKTKETMVKKCNPWFGFGFGQFMKISPYTQKAIIKHGVHRYEHAHNDYIEVLFDLGRVGVVLLIALFVDMVLLFKKAKKTPLLVASAAAILAYAVCALAIYTVHTATGGVFLAIYLGLFLAEALNTENLNGT
jgi:O-antigen ligase